MLIAALFVTLLAAPVSPGPPGARHQQLDLHRYTVLPDSSRIFVVTHKSGLLSFLGHEHAIVPTDWSAELCLGDPVPAGARGALTIQTGSLVIDSDSARSIAGLGEGPGVEDRREIQQKMLDSSNLAADRHPEIRLELEARDSALHGRFTAAGSLTVRGMKRSVETPVRVHELEGDSSGLRLEGRLQVGQRAFGIEPESVAGVVNVANEVDLHFSLAAAPTDRPCESD